MTVDEIIERMLAVQDAGGDPEMVTQAIDAIREATTASENSINELQETNTAVSIERDTIMQENENLKQKISELKEKNYDLLTGAITLTTQVNPPKKDVEEQPTKQEVLDGLFTEEE